MAIQMGVAKTIRMHTGSGTGTSKGAGERTNIRIRRLCPCLPQPIVDALVQKNAVAILSSLHSFLH